jgi:hypothetical protein
MKSIKNHFFEGERILFGLKDAEVDGVTFGQGESPLKEANNIKVKDSVFKWKYPLWYDQNVEVEDSVFETMARSGIWYTKNISIKNSSLQAPKLFRRAQKITLDNVHFANAEETMWSCDGLKITNSQISGDYFGKDSKNIYLDHVSIIGNYAFDGAENIEVHNSTFVAKDAFWNCKNVKVYDSTIDGEYLAWNSENVEFINCKIISSQGLNYVNNLKLRDTQLLHTDLAFEYVSNIDAEVTSKIDSVKNPISGKISAPVIGELIMDKSKIDPADTKIDCDKIELNTNQSDRNQEPKD